MPGKMNWARAGMASRLRRYGQEPIAHDDRSLASGRPNAKEAKAKPKAAKRVRKADIVETASFAATKRREQQISAETQHAERAKRKKEAAAKAAIQRQHRANAAKLAAEQRNANYQRRLAEMTLAERAAHEFEKARRADVRLRGVIVEHRPLPKSKTLIKSIK